MMTYELLDTPALAALLGVPERTLTQWRYKRTGPAFVKVGAGVRYRSDDVEAWLDAQRVTPGAA
jgi:predicted DNA-binding transcriptional regulator AlpA